MTIIKNHFEVFILTSKKHGNAYRVKSWVIFNKGQFTHPLNVSYGQDSVSGIVQWPAIKTSHHFSVTSKSKCVINALMTLTFK
jgi:hypothetical protein